MIKTNYDIVIIGSGIGGIMCAKRLLELDMNKSILLIDRGSSLRNRYCPINGNATTKCVNCSNCSIMSGFAGAGAFSDAKFNITNEYGGWLDEYIDPELSLKYMKEVCETLFKFTDRIFNPYHPDYNLRSEALKYDLHLLQGDVIHFGTDGIYDIMESVEGFLKSSNNIDILFNTNIDPNNISVKDHSIKISNKNIESQYVNYEKLILALGRSGANDFQKFCKNNDIKTGHNQIDIGVRVELPRMVCEEVSKKIYEPKIKYFTKRHRDFVRTFCFNSGGEVVTENTNGILTVNGHACSNESHKTKNSNFAILSTHKFTEPFNEPVEYLQNIAKLANMLGGGKIIAQLFGDLIDGRRSTEKRIKESTIIPTLKSFTPGDISLALPSAAMDNIIEMIYQLDKFMPGVANHDTLLYGIEAKYYSQRPYFIDNYFKIHDEDVYAIGDGAGVTRSLSQAGAMGLYVADNLYRKDNGYV